MEHHEGHGPVTDAERAISAAALGELERIPPGRLRTLLVAAVRHLHTFAMHTRLTDDELRAGLDFLMRAGQESTAERNELVILSDVPGLSAVVDVITHDAPDGATPSALLGPFHRPGAPRREDGAWMARPDTGPPMVLTGTVRSTSGTALAGAELDVWHAGANGLYDQQDPGVPAWHCRGRYRTGADGRFRIRTVRPVPYHVPTDGRAGELLRAAGRGALRAAHVHARVHAAGHRALTTQWFDLGDAYLKTDATYSVRDGLVRPWAEVTDEAAAAELGVPCPFTRLELEIVLAPGPHDVGDGRA